MKKDVRGLVLVCDREGVMESCVRDDFAIAAATSRRPFVMLLDGSSYQKGLSFFSQVDRQGDTVVDMELCFAVGGNPLVLTVAAARLGPELVVAAADSTQALSALCGELAHSDAARSDAYKRIAAIYDQPRTSADGYVYDEYMRMYNDFARLQRDFARQNARLRRVGTEKDLILDMAAHDLRNPLNAICLLASSVASAAKSRLTDGELASLEKIDKTARDMGDLLNNLLAHRRDESGMNAIERVDTDIVSLARRRIDLAMPLAAEKAVAIVVDTTRSHVMFPVDPARLQQVFDNLLGNAIRYSPQNGDIVFSIDTTGDELRISISDRGPGIPDERLSRVFEPFYRGEPSTAKEASGMGLGLAICRNIVLAHGGQIWAKNRTGGGTKLNLRIPRHSPTHRRDDHGSEDLALAPDGPSGSTMDPAVAGRPILLRASESSAPSRSPHALRTRS